MFGSFLSDTIMTEDIIADRPFTIGMIKNQETTDESIQNGIIKCCQQNKNKTKSEKKYDWYKYKNNIIINKFTTTVSVSPDYNLFYCDICYEYKSDYITINNCDHKLCSTCLNNIVNTKNSYLHNFLGNKYYELYILNNSYVNCPFCRCSFSFLDTCHYIKSKLYINTRELIILSKNKKDLKNKLKNNF